MSPASVGTATQTPDTDPVDDRALHVPAWRRILAGNGTWVLGLDLILIALFTWLSPNNVFWSAKNLQNQLLNGSEGLLLAIAMTILLSAGLFDISLGVNLAFSSVVGAWALITVSGGSVALLGGASSGDNVYANVGVGLVAGFLAAVGTGMTFGLVNGVIIAYLRVNSLIATLGTLSVGTGLMLLLTSGADIGGLPPELQDDFGLATLFGVIPYPFLLALLVVVIVWFTFRYLKTGLHTLAIGSSRNAADRAGIKVRLHVVKLTVTAGAIAGLAGFVNLSHFGATSINGHANDPLAAITAAVIGGTALAGGRVSVIGTVWGSALAGILLGGLVIIGVSAFWQLVAIGSVLIIAVSIDQFRTRRREDE